MADPISLRLLVMRTDTGNWIAVSLERYIMAQGQSADEAVAAFKRTLEAEIRFGLRINEEQPLASKAAAPVKYWNAYESARPSPSPVKTTGIDIEGFTRVPVHAVREMHLSPA